MALNVAKVATFYKTHMKKKSVFFKFMRYLFFFDIGNIGTCGFYLKGVSMRVILFFITVFVGSVALATASLYLKDDGSCEMSFSKYDDGFVTSKTSDIHFSGEPQIGYKLDDLNCEFTTTYNNDASVMVATFKDDSDCSEEIKSCSGTYTRQ